MEGMFKSKVFARQDGNRDTVTESRSLHFMIARRGGIFDCLGLIFSDEKMLSVRICARAAWKQFSESNMAEL